MNSVSTDLAFAEIEAGIVSLFAPRLGNRDEDDYSYKRSTEVWQIVVREWRQNMCPHIRQMTHDGTWTVARYEQLCGKSLKLIEELHRALHLLGIYQKLSPVFWEHQALDLFNLQKDSRGFSIDPSMLSDVATKYLKHPELRTNRIDWLLLEGLLFERLESATAEAWPFISGMGAPAAASLAEGSQVKYLCWRATFFFIKVGVFYIAPLAIAYGLFSLNHKQAAVVTLAVFALLLAWQAVTFPVRFRAKRRLRTKLVKLGCAYNLLRDTTIYPRGLKESLDSAAAAGALIAGDVYAIVDRILARDATAFIP